MRGITWEVFAALTTDTQTRIGGTAFVLIVAAAGTTYCRHLWLRKTTDDAQITDEHGPLLEWVKAHQTSWPVTREERRERRRLWAEENQQRTGGNPPTEPAEDTVNRIFGDVFATDLPQRRATTPPPARPAVGTAPVIQPGPPVTAPDQINVESVLADLRAWAADPDRTGLIEPIVSWKGYRA